MANPNLPTQPATGLLVDYGGVLTTSIHDSFTEFCVREALDATAFRKALGLAFADPASPAARVETGLLDPSAFDVELARFLTEGIGSPVSAERLVERLFHSVRREPSMVEAVRRLRASGVTTSWGGAAYEDEVLEMLFDHRVVSGDVGLRKPDAAIYEHALALGGLEASACVFIDDLPLNCEGARAVGIDAIHHIDPATSIPALSARFDVDLSDLLLAS
jgi:epoxide hydrolase-like predicted phosphatase